MIIDNRAEQALVAEMATNYGYRKKEIRSYEVSLWTLLDSFITVLKWSDVEQLGRIENAQMKLNIDGTESLTFTIPMYIIRNGVRIDNPSWYSVRDKLIIKNMRKIKVIFNKGEPQEQVFEFLIIDVTEEHASDALNCSVTCEGLAFNELGKIGYQYSLSPEIFYEEVEEWFKTLITAKPKLNIDYWCKLIDLEKLPTSQSELAKCNARTWYYEVKMNWSGYENGVFRDSHTIYEEAYASEWNADLLPIKIEAAREKERPVSIEKSNLYNITLTIAETFGVFCRYEYLHNSNYQITGRRIIFYNNFFSEESGMITFNYPHYTNKISRKTDGSNLTTKLYVADVETADTYEGVYSIMNAESNISHENYIMNFDYMLEIGAISLDLYDKITPYIKSMKLLNEELSRLLHNRDEYELRIPKLEAEIAMCDKNITTATEQRNLNMQLLINLGARDGTNDGLIDVDENRPDSTVIIKAGNGKGYIKLDNTNKGIISGTIRVYSSYNTTSHKLVANSEIKNFTIKTDEYGYATMLLDVLYPAGSSVVYLTYSYNPFLYYDTIIKTWDSVLGENILKQADLRSILGEKNSAGEGTSGLYLIYTETQNAIKEKLEEKKKSRKEFERLMGPALREGYWSPEDYADFGDMREADLPIPTNIDNSVFSDNTGHNMVLGWDTLLFEDEDKLSYQVGMEESSIEYYPCVNLAPLFYESGFLKDHKLTEYSVTFVSNQIETLKDGAENRLKNRESYKVGSEAILRYVQYNGEIVPILVLVGAKKLTADLLRWLYGDSSHPQTTCSRPALAIIDGTKQDTQGFLVLDTDTSQYYYSLVGQSYWINDLDASQMHEDPNASLLELRLKCSSLDLKTDASSLSIKYIFNEDNPEDYTILLPYEHYYINTRNTYDTLQKEYRVELYITIKPEVLISHLARGYILVEYIISNASLAIYLDAVLIMKENAKPKVSYEITPTILNTNLINHLYDTLALIVMINDTDLKLVNTFGYISELNLDLDNIANDSVVIQNYTSKFEDLFSSIVASTEGLQRALGVISSAMNGNIPLSESGLMTTFEGNTNILLSYLNSYFDGSEIVEKKLLSLFTEAAGILGDANLSLNYSRALSRENATILRDFAEKALDTMRTKIYTGSNKPLHFKIGDVWTYEEDGITYTYVAISNSEDVDDKGTSGFTRTHDGSLAQITGTALNIDAESGKINITASNEINLLSGDVKIAAKENVYIYGNKQVDISGPTINLTSYTDDQNVNSTSGINLMQVDHDSNTDFATVTRVNINPNKILMAGSELEILTRADSETSAMKLNNDGIKIASTGGISLFAGAIDSSNLTGGSVSINHEHVYLSYYNANSNAASNIALDVNGIILAAGTAALSAKNVGSASSGLTGAKITKDSIGLATVVENSRNAFLMNSAGFTIGSGNVDVSAPTIDLSGANVQGSYIRLSGDKLELGSLSDLYINTNNFKILTNVKAANGAMGSTVFAIGSKLNDLNDGDYTGVDPAKLPANSNVNFLVNSLGAYINGYVYAKGGSFNGDVYATSFLLANGQYIPYSQISDPPTIPDPADFKVDGITGPVTWNEKTYNVCLSSSNSLLIGVYQDDNGNLNIVDGGITIASSQNHAAVDITRSHINFDYNNDNYIHINSNGVDIQGSRMTINGTPVYAGDNILYGSEELVRQLHEASGYTGPWIWIKPNPTNYLEYINKTDSQEIWNARTGTFTCSSGTSAANHFADGGTYNYSIVVRLKNIGSNYLNPAKLKVTLRSTLDSTKEVGASISIPGVQSNYVAQVEGTIATNVDKNLAGNEDGTMTVLMSTTGSQKMQAYSVVVKCQSSSNTEASLCSVYYYV